MYHAVDVTVLCEPHSFEWMSFEWFIEKWNQGRDRMGVYALPYVLNVQNPVRPTKRLWSLLNGSFRSCASTDARDKLYAVMSMAADPQPHILSVDYDASVAMVFSRAAAVLFYQVGLNILSAIRGPSTVAGTPTWVPDWTMSSEADKIYNKADNDIMRPLHPAGGPPDWTVAELTSAPRGSANWPSGHPGLVLRVRGVRIGRIRWIGEPWDPKDDWRIPVRRWKPAAQGLNIRQYPSARPIDPSLSRADPLSSSIGQQEHASKAQYPTQANGGYEVTDMDMFKHLLAAGCYKDVEDSQKLRKELEENGGVSQLWLCKFDHDTLFQFDWPKGVESNIFKDVNLTRKTVPSGCEIFYRTVIADEAHTLGGDWRFGAYHIFGERLYSSGSDSGQGPPPAAKDETQRQNEIRLYEKAARNAMASRRLFVTDEGYVGLAPKEAAVDDVVVVFLGDMNPSVLKWRANPSSFDFVGQCYVFGASFGEAVKHIHVSRLLAKVPKVPLEDFLLW